MCVFFAKKPQKLPKSAQCEPPKNYKAALITTYLKSISNEWQILYASFRSVHISLQKFSNKMTKRKKWFHKKKMMSQLEFFLHNLLKVWVKRYVVSNKVKLWFDWHYFILLRIEISYSECNNLECNSENYESKENRWRYQKMLVTISFTQTLRKVFIEILLYSLPNNKLLYPPKTTISKSSFSATSYV